MRESGYNYLKKITAVDFSNYLEVVYILYNTEEKKEEIVKVRLEPKSPSIVSVVRIYAAADWYERELSEMFGITIIGRKSERLLLEKWNGKEPPLLKSFVWGNPNYKKQIDLDDNNKD